MNLAYTHLLPVNFSASARVWIYQATRLFSLTEAFTIEERIDSFTAQWQSHGQPVQAKGFLFDGFPRTSAQAEALDKLLSLKNAPIAVMLALEVSEEELITRLMKRGETSGRSDDTNMETIKARIAEYHKKTTAVADYYRQFDKVASVAITIITSCFRISVSKSKFSSVSELIFKLIINF